MPTPRQDETRQEFVSRCIPVVLEDGTAESQDQAVAICNSMWRESEEQGKMTEKQMERKVFSGFVTKADEVRGVIEAIFAVFGNVDSGEDIVHPGAFTKTFTERGRQVRVLDNHRATSVNDALGKPLNFREVGREELPQKLLEKHPDATGGAWAEIQFNMKTRGGHDAFWHLKDGDVDQWSFGYDALDTDFGVAVRDGKEVNIRNLRTVKLYEISPVIFGMNEATQTVSAKSDDPIEQFVSDMSKAVAQAEEDAIMGKGVSGATNLPDEAKIGRVISAATGKRIQGAIDGIQSALGSLEKMLIDAGVTAAPTQSDESEEENDKSAPAEHEQAALEKQSEQAGPQTAPTSKEMLEQIERHLQELGG